MVPWHGIGAVLDGVLMPDEAIKAAKLDWNVNQIPGYVDKARSDSREVLGIGSDRYCVAQNQEVLAFADELTGTNHTRCTHETISALWNGRRVFMLVNMPQGRILGDDYQSCLCLSNAHDGSAPLQVFLTGIRVVRNNAIKRKMSIRHGAVIKTRRNLKAFLEDELVKKGGCHAA
jgi:hypothetical protein